jgi:hypothetical protein
MSALDDIAAERRRQIDAEGWTPEHDDAHRIGEMAQAAACYAIGSGFRDTIEGDEQRRPLWPWDWSWWKPKDRRRDLVRAGALIVAEIERLDRLELLAPRERREPPPLQHHRRMLRR